MVLANDTLPNGRPGRTPEAGEPRDRTTQLARLVRHALKGGAVSTPLDRAIRSAATGAGADEESRVAALTARLNDLLGRCSPRPHLETICG